MILSSGARVLNPYSSTLCQYLIIPSISVSDTNYGFPADIADTDADPNASRVAMTAHNISISDSESGDGADSEIWSTGDELSDWSDDEPAPPSARSPSPTKSPKVRRINKQPAAIDLVPLLTRRPPILFPSCFVTAKGFVLLQQNIT